jgi:hypothetical protein
MAIDEQSDDNIALIFKDDEDLENGTLSVSSKESDHLLDFSTAWSKIRSVTVSGKKVLYEGKKQLGASIGKFLQWQEQQASVK